MRVAIYARYSSDLQNPRSIEDQIAICKDYASKNNYEIVNTFTDAAISGATLNRPGIQALLQSTGYDAVLCEALDRLSRDLADIATIQKRLTFADKQIITLDDGIVNDVHVGVKGMLNQLFLQQLAKKTHRGLQGKVSQGLSAGGISYGYDIDNKLVKGQLMRGGRSINSDHAVIIRRIFIDYAINDKSPRTIAKELNNEEIPFLNGKQWNVTTISGNRRRGTGIINNELYIGRLVWNKLKYKKDPVTGKRASFLRPQHEWHIKELPELRIIDDGLWQAVKQKQKQLDARDSDYKPKKRATYMMSNLIKCSCCGSGVAMRNAVSYACSRAKNKGTCDNNAYVKREKLEQSVLSIIIDELLTSDVIDTVVVEYNNYYKELVNQSVSNEKKNKAQVIKLEREQKNLIESIKQGVPVDLIKDELDTISGKLETLKIASTPKISPLVDLSNVAERFKAAVKALATDSMDHDAKVQIRRLIDKAVLKEDGEVDLYIDLSGLLDKKIPANSSEYLPMVAGAGFIQKIPNIISRCA